MNAASLLLQLQERGIELWAEGKRIRFSAPPRSLADVDRAALASHREDLLPLLREQAASRVEHLPLSAGQQSLWLLDQLARGASVNNLGTAVRLPVPADVPASTIALQSLFDRHAMLRTTVRVEDGTLTQRVAGTLLAMVEVTPAIGLNEVALRGVVEAELARPFDLETGPLLRLTLFDRGADGHVLLLSLHHVAGDALSILVLLGEFLACWTEARGGPPAQLPSLKRRYADFIKSEAAMLAGPEGDRMWRHWRLALADLPPLLRLPADRVRTAMPSFRGGTVPFTVSADIVGALFTVARETQATLFTVLLSSWSMFLARKTGAVDMVIGTPFSIREDEGSYGVVGDFVNALPLRVRVRWSDRLRDAVGRNRSVVVDAMDAGAFPIQEIINRLGADRVGGSPLFNVFLNVQQLHVLQEDAALARGIGDGIDCHGTRVMPFRLHPQPSQHDLTLNASWFGGAELHGSMDYAADLFDAATVEALVADYLGFLSELVFVPDARLLPLGERDRLLNSFQGRAALPGAPFPTQFRASAARTPRNIAVRCGGASLDYRTLRARSDTLAARLRSQGGGPGIVIGVLIERSIGLLEALLAVQAAGAILLPMDPAFPPARLAHMLSDSGATILLSDRGRPDWVGDATAVLDPASMAPIGGVAAYLGTPDPAHTAYILYTSGSTGTPAGVRVSHRALSNLLGAIVAEPGLRGTDVFAAVTTISFDIAYVELFAPLLVGATVEIVPQHVGRNGKELADDLARSGATIMQATPATWWMLVEADWRPAPGFRAMSGGEAMTSDLAAALLSRSVALWNLYGPTETTIYSTGGRVLDPEAIDVGRPIANTNVYVVDAHDDLVPVGVTGRVWIGGTGLADGYHERPERTAQRFRADPFKVGDRIYDTGDVGRWTEAGRLDLVGRSDDQIKLRGFRIEPGEIEAALFTHPDIHRAVVTARRSADDLRLVAFIVPEPGTVPTTGELRRHVRQLLPDYMVPALFVTLEALPTTPNGKIDQRSLPNPFELATPARTGRLPSPGMEQRLADVWQEVLGIEHVSADDKFFEIGGHSLLALRVTASLERNGIKLRPTALFYHSLAQIAEMASRDR